LLLHQPHHPFARTGHSLIGQLSPDPIFPSMSLVAAYTPSYEDDDVDGDDDTDYADETDYDDYNDYVIKMITVRVRMLLD
jgi:hypothetical protein